MKESMFGGFGQENPDKNGSMNDDSYVMGDEELQIVGLSMNSKQNKEMGDGKVDNDDDDNCCVGGSGVSVLNPLSSLLRQNKGDSMTSDGFDVCMEYGYRYEYTEDDDSENLDDREAEEEEPSACDSILTKLGMLPLVPSDIGNNHSSGDGRSSGKTSRRNRDNEKSYQTYILGKSYHPINEYHAKRDDESNLFWFTYRCDFLEIKPYNITSDAGWGCMLRSAQMLLGQVMRIHWKGRDWKVERNLKLRREDQFMRNLLTWFADYPCSDVSERRSRRSWYSLHNMVAAGYSKYDIMPGEWFGPGTACYVLRDLVQLHSKSLESNGRDDSSDYYVLPDKPQNCALKVYVAPEGTIYQSDLRDLLVDKKSHADNNDVPRTKGNASNKMKKGKRPTKKTKKGKFKFFHPLCESPDSGVSKDVIKEEWNAALLILIPLRLGLKKFNGETYKLPLARMMSLPQSVGFIGGSPRHALWFYGANSDGSKVFGLDPHTVQRAPRCRRLSPQECQNGRDRSGSYDIIFSDEYLRSINCPKTSSMDMARIDPSLALGFYFRDREDFELFQEALKLMKSDDELKNYPDLFTIADAKPDYAADVSSAVMDLMMNSMMDGDDDGNADDDDDDYIIL